MDKIRVVLCEPGKIAREVEIENSLEAFQAAVGGNIEVVVPEDHVDGALIVCNEDGKIIHLPLNRIVGYMNASDIICSTFIICDSNIESGEFISLDDGQVDLYLNKYKYPIVRTAERKDED